MDILTWKYGKPLTDENALDRLANTTGVVFPASYVACVMQNNGGYPQPGIFDYPGQPGAVFQRLLPVDGPDGGGVLRAMRNLDSRLAAGYVPFAEDPFGNFLCFRYPASGEPAVYFWNHETEATTKVCGSFSELLSMLHT